MRRIISINELKDRIVAKAYYLKELNGGIGKSSGNFWHSTYATCIFHADKRPGTFFINIQTGCYKCFSCGAQGDLIDYHKQKYGLPLPEAIQHLGREY